ncbi:ribosomal protein L7/L12 [Pedobacter miscanthi]|jgi:ribosomal protein L7/L12|uniref:ribosomal protein L7/L12 n=1 Tax=Pedobacter miscanthi TaxID=2259170 RepID=UPI002931599E|nr:ribosomal protein L7/L12 [Pedobacter miscanthi]
MIDVSPEIQQEAQFLIAGNQKILAVKLIMDKTRCGLKEAKDYIDDLQIGFQKPASNPAHLDEEVLAILSQGNKLNAIKHYKDATGLGLAESKDYVEKLMHYKVIGNTVQQSRDTDIKNIIANNSTNNPFKKFLIKLLIIILIAIALTYLMFKI